jgi:hypothetical protein
VRSPATGPTPPPALPRVLVWVSGAVVVAGVAMALAGAFRTGITWDEPYHVMRLRNYFDHGWFALDWALPGHGSAAADSNTLVYGPVAMLLLHGLSALLGVEGWHSVATTPAAYDARHLGVVLIGLAGTAAAAGITRIVLGSWRWALFSAAALLALPMWTGHLMFNIKDVPVATGYTLMTLGLVAMVAPVQGRRVLRVAGVAAGIILMVGTRPAMATAVVAGVVVLAAGVVVSGRFGNARSALAEAAAGVVLAAVALVTIYPAVFTHPLNLVRSADQSASFRGGQTAIYGYVPFHVLAQTPLLLLAFFTVGLVSTVTFVRRRWRTDTSDATRLTLVGLQLCALPLLAVVRHSDLYNGLRQLLFATPAWAILTTVGLARALVWARERGRTRVVSGLALAAIAAPMVDQALLFPYQYAYFNVALDATGVHVPSDYWRTSVPELLPRIPTDGQIVCGPTRSSTLGAVAGTPDAKGIDPGALLAGRYSSDSSVDCRTDPLGPLAPSWSAERLGRDDTLPHDAFYALIDRDHQLPENCTRLAAVTRYRHLRELSMTYVARCHLAPSDLGETSVSFTRPAGENMAPLLWAYAPEGWVMRGSTTAIDAAEDSASLTFATGDECARQACALVLDADAPADLVASVNDAPADVATTPGSVVVTLPPGAQDIWVSFTRTSAEPLGLRVRSLRVIPSANR